MNPDKTGAFIAQVRRDKALTQKELAKMLNVSDKAISRWETGKGYPDIELLPLISSTLGVSVNEILNGEYGNNSNEAAEENLVCLCNAVTKKQYLKNLDRVLYLICAGGGVFVSGKGVFYTVFLVVCTLLAVSLLIYDYVKYSSRNINAQILFATELISTAAFSCFYAFVYYKFTTPGTINFIFIPCSFIFLLPLIIDMAINKNAKQ